MGWTHFEHRSSDGHCVKPECNKKRSRRKPHLCRVRHPWEQANDSSLTDSMWRRNEYAADNQVLFLTGNVSETRGALCLDCNGHRTTGDWWSSPCKTCEATGFFRVCKTDLSNGKDSAPKES